MGPITGIRILNLRVRDKVAYPDVTLDLVGKHADHLVVGLENGGGKSTLLGAVYHVFVPEADEFLPRRAQKRQGKHGEPKRLEDYVPGGDPTHFIVELDAPIPAGTLPLGGSPRILIGACLWKPAGAPAGTRATETFWSARGVSPLLSLRELVVRGPSGRLLDHAEFVARLKQVRTELPAAQVTIETVKHTWQEHLRSLGIDVDYVRQFLLRMNEDEGAADRVFTYASSREFLNSLVGVVGDPDAIAQLKTRLVETADDAATVVLDRKRVTLLEGLATQTQRLAQAMKDLAPRQATRERTVRQVIATRQRSAAHFAAATAAARELSDRKEAMERSVADARTAYGDTHARFVRSKLQVAELDVKAATQDADRVEQDRIDARLRERVSLAAALLADRRTAESRIRDLDGLLTQKELDAEPLRVMLASAVRALDQRIAADLRGFERELAEINSIRASASDEYVRAISNAARAEATLASLATEGALLDRETAEIAAQIAAAVASKLIASADADAATAAKLARERSATEAARADELERVRIRESNAISGLQAKDAELASALGRTQGETEKARRELEHAEELTRALEEALTNSGFIETHSVSLPTHALSIRDRLGAVIEAARLRQASAAVGAAAAKRATTWLVEQERLPPRADVERLCERAQGKRLGAHPGWSYLAKLPADVAERYAAAHPSLADGIVVPVPEDRDAVVTLITEARQELDGPLVVGMPAAFDKQAAHISDTIVVLPSEAYWSGPAARALTPARNNELSRWDEELAGANKRADSALMLRTRLETWSSEIGAEGVDQRRNETERLRSAVAALETQRASLRDDLAARVAARDEAEGTRDAARSSSIAASSEAVRLDVLAVAQKKQLAMASRLGEINTGVHDAEQQRGLARDTAARAADRRDAAVTRSGEVERERGMLAAQRQEISGLATLVVRPADSIATSDEVADRLLLAEHVRDREARWRGAVSDPQLRSQLDALRTEMRGLDKRIEEYRDIESRARALLGADSSRSADDYRRDADEARGRIEEFGERVGELKARAKQLEEVASDVRTEIRGLRRPAELAMTDRTDDREAALVIRDRLLKHRDEAMQLRVEREAALVSATDEAGRAGARAASLEPIPQRLTAALRNLVRGGSLVGALEVVDTLPDDEVSSLLSEAGLPEALATIVRAYDTAMVFDADDRTTMTALSEIDDLAEEIQAQLAALERQANTTLDAIEALLRNTSDDVVKNDRMIQLFRTAARPALTNLSVAHHGDVEQRLQATRHHVATFDDRLEALGETVYATVAALLREVRQTVRDSQLPSTPAMGRWAGAELLKLSGLDTLKVEQKKAAIAATLRDWFDLDSTEKRSRRFDSDEVVYELLSAVAPQFAAKILIPSDPLDPEHMPVDLLARETSGGEGVAVALIMASLLASRRASMRGHRRTTLMLDNPFAKVTKPEFLRLARDVASELNVQLVLFTGIRDVAALAVFPQLTQLRVSRRQNANFVVPHIIDDDRLQPLLREGTLYVSPAERAAAEHESPGTWPLMSMVTVTNKSAAIDRDE